MLVLSRHTGQKVEMLFDRKTLIELLAQVEQRGSIIGSVSLAAIQGNKVRLGFDFPTPILIRREELNRNAS